MVINEIFRSIQGEGRHMGRPALFIRTQGCSLHCPWCDSARTWGYEGKEMSVDYILKLVQSSIKPGDIVVITGGEPTEQHDLYELASELKYLGISVHLETNGTEDIDRGYFEWVVCSPKPGNNYEVPSGVDELKYVVGADDDVYKMISAGILHKFAGRIWLQPKADGDTVPRSSIDACINAALKDPRLRVGVQLHKVLGVR